jgi:hypothetical protein
MKSSYLGAIEHIGQFQRASSRADRDDTMRNVAVLDVEMHGATLGVLGEVGVGEGGVSLTRQWK